MAVIDWLARAAIVGTAAAVLPAGATEPATSRQTATDCPVELAGGRAGDWLPGKWINNYYTLIVERRGNELHWTMSREAHPSERWGSKAAMTASGTIAEATPCTAELRGYYDSSDNGYLPGKPLTYRTTWDGGTRMSGLLLGAGREWTPISFGRVPTGEPAN
ncbi:MAG: hypothetical protein AB7N54_02530 [Alphaproteobacteria bacterium]